MIGRTLSHYKILSEISRGGMGIVYRAVDVKLDREVALKVLPPELVADSERKRRFVQEAKAAAKLEHPHIGVIHEVDETDGATFIVMELIQGEKLKDILQREHLSPTRCLELAIEVAEGLARAHDKGIVHRDLKPANIMVTEDGHAKIIDFGLAKLVEPLAGDGSQDETAARGETDPGRFMGTVSYVSPEQARGKTVDHRSDVFSFGIVLHEMLTGQAPFQGDSGVDTLHAILNRPTPRLQGFSNATDDATFAIQHIVDKCLEKAPRDRYQTTRDVVVDLRAARRQLESGSVATVVQRRRPTSWLLAGAATLLSLLLAVALWISRRPEARESASESASRPSIAVLYFDNASGDPDLDWLRTGLTDMLVTDLSQSPNIRVLSMERLYHILRDMNRLDERITSLEVLQEMAEMANTPTVILGSYMKAGENIRINIRIQDARSGEILTTEKVEGLGESSIFTMVDDLTQRIKTNFEIPSLPEELQLDAVTTSSMEAYRYYVEGMQLHYRSKEQEAVPLLEKAVQADTDFAMALARLSAVHGNLGHPTLADEYAQRAFEHIDRLPPRERYYVEGRYYGTRLETIGQAIEAYEDALILYPDDLSAKGNLVSEFLGIERFNEAIRHGEELMARDDPFSGTYANLADSYSAVGELEKGYQALQHLLRRRPESSAGHRWLSANLVRWGKLDEAIEALRKAESLEPGHPEVQWIRCELFTLREDWSQAEAAATQVRSSEDPFWIALGALSLAQTQLYRGRSQKALHLLKDSIEVLADSDTQRAWLHKYASSICFNTGETSRALEHAKSALSADRGRLWQLSSLLAIGLAQARLGRWENVQETAAILEKKADQIPSTIGERTYHHLAGDLALVRDDIPLAIRELEQARTMLPTRGFYPGALYSPHAFIWFSLGSAYLAANEHSKAAESFQRITESTTERIYWPIPYVRSFYFLGKIHENRGEMEKAREYYRRFYEYWKDGDMDRERVEEARKKAAS